MSGHRHSFQNITSSDEAAAFSNNPPQVRQPISLLHNPPELVTRILLYLSPRDIISCKRTCRMLYDLCSCPALRYLVQLERNAVSDDMRPGLGYLERLRVLENREEAWATLDFRLFAEIDAPFDSTGTYDFTGGALILGTSPSNVAYEHTLGYSYISLPSLSGSEGQELEWKGFSFGTKTLDFGLAVHEHDLIAALTAKNDVHHPSDWSAILELRLLEFSTGRPHPLAEQPIVFIDSKILPLNEWSVEIEIVGDFLILLVSFFEWSENQDIFFLVRWKTGVTHRLGSPEKGTYRHFSHLSQDTLVIPNLIQNTLEVTKIVIDGDDAPRLVLLCVLHLPPLAENTSLYHYYCRAEPNPTCSEHISIPSPSDRPFRDKAEDAIVTFNMSYDRPSRTWENRNWVTFIVHRRALLGHIPAAHRACAPFCSPSEPMSAVVQLPWSAWGPPATRLFVGNSTPMYWISTTAGQRAVMLADELPSPIIVRDFNPYAVRAALALAAESGQSQQANWSKQLPDGNRMTLTVEDSVLTAGSIFKEDVRSSLPYVEIVTQNEYWYNGLMMDDERILGFRTSRQDQRVISFFGIHVFG